MRTFPASRKRYASEPMVQVGGLARIMQGVFGLGSPAAGLASQQVRQDAAHPGGPYAFFEGDVFLPGTSNWVVDPTHDGPLMTVWGHAFLRRPNGFNPLQTPQVMMEASSYLYGLGGQVAGQLVTQPLSNTQEIGAQ